MYKKENVSVPVIRRLPRYYRFLQELIRSGETRISSKELSERMGSTASQIRQDFNCFGGFGQQGYGYNIPMLCQEIGQILGLDKTHKCILIGAGNLGKTITSHMSFEKMGFELIGIFDNNPAIIGTELKHYTIQAEKNLSAFIKKEKPVMAILCLPREPVNNIVKLLYQNNVKSFWNFSHYDINIEYPDAIVENVHLNDSLMTLCYKIAEKDAD